MLGVKNLSHFFGMSASKMKSLSVVNVCLLVFYSIRDDMVLLVNRFLDKFGPIGNCVANLPCAIDLECES